MGSIKADECDQSAPRSHYYSPKSTVFDEQQAIVLVPRYKREDESLVSIPHWIQIRCWNAESV